MLDKGKVIKGIHDARKYLEDRELVDKSVGVHIDALNDALSLLKEQEAVKPIRDENCGRMFRCGACGEYVGFIDSDPGDPNEQDNYCRNCGRSVNWNNEQSRNMDRPNASMR